MLNSPGGIYHRLITRPRAESISIFSSHSMETFARQARVPSKSASTTHLSMQRLCFSLGQKTPSLLNQHFLQQCRLGILLSWSTQLHELRGHCSFMLAAHGCLRIDLGGCCYLWSMTDEYQTVFWRYSLSSLYMKRLWKYWNLWECQCTAKFDLKYW